tara:strand:- start:74 stop:424 length:351 start_codon:yes stop_codon:yes gene_type:complete
MPTFPKSKIKTWVVKREKNNPHSRGAKTHNEMMNIYQSQQWRSTRRYHIQRNPLCVHCKEDNKIVSGNVVDHIKPIRQGGSAFDLMNLQTLCDDCHNIKSRKEKDSIVYTKSNMYR